MANPSPKVVWAASAASATNGATMTSAVIDRKGYDFVSIDVLASTQSASTQAGSPSVLKIQECDTTVATSFADVVGFRGASAAATNVDFVVPVGYTSTTSGLNNYKFNVDCRARKRYLSVVVSPTTTQTFTVFATLSKGKEAASSATKAGALNLIEA